MPPNKFTQKKCSRFNREKCECITCKVMEPSKSIDKNKRKSLRLNIYGLKIFEGLPPFYISKL
jgi:hypothetical protein